ncbi:MAG: hypothetical protein JST40_13085 [Armatimonadetes bacterium]|nr:hypothetical protein [Armatimonadota bacterium]
MKLALLGIAAASLVIAWVSPEHPKADFTLVVVGDFHGSLTPCGCTKPMSGGLARMATAVDQIRARNKVVVVANGAMTSGSNSRQTEMKAETLAEALRVLDAEAINLAATDKALGTGLEETFDRLSGERLIRDELRPELTLSNGWIAASWQQGKPVPHADILLVDGGLDSARTLAGTPKVIVYRSNARPPARPEMKNASLLLTPGESGKFLIQLDFRANQMVRYQVTELGPSFRDHRSITQILSRYLQRVGRENLLGKLPRQTSDQSFAGSRRCGSCHQEEFATWKTTRHSDALATLEETKHDRDPDCVGCHVVGLSQSTGFQSRQKTPELADVGCESCHGPGGKHADEPAQNKMAVVGEKSCAPCHVLDHSPGFNFEKYWEKVRHGESTLKTYLENLGKT